MITYKRISVNERKMKQANEIKPSICSHNSILHYHITSIIKVRAEIINAFEPLEFRQYIKPIHCDVAIASVKLLQQVASDLCLSVGNSEPFAHAIGSYYYRLLVFTYKIDEHAIKLMSIVKELRSNCYVALDYKEESKLLIHRKVSLLLETSKNIEVEARLLALRYSNKIEEDIPIKSDLLM